MPQGRNERKQRSNEDGNFNSLRLVIGGANGVGPPLLNKANKITLLLRCLDNATANEHLFKKKKQIII